MAYKIIITYIITIILIYFLVRYLVNGYLRETFENNIKELPTTEEITGNSLCSIYSSKPTELNDKCGTLTETNCNTASCCVWLNGSNCVAGNVNGPTFRTKEGKPIIIDNYYYMGKLNGKK